MIYTWASNLHKTDDMATGAVSFKNQKLIKNLHVEKDKDILKRIIKTKQEAYPDLKSNQRALT